MNGIPVIRTTAKSSVERQLLLCDQACRARGWNFRRDLAMPQIGYALSPHIQMEKGFLFLGALARGLCPVQLFPANYLYPDANLGSLAKAPAPIFADILPVTGGFAFPVVDCEPDPWRTLAKFGQSDRYYGYPFHEAGNSRKDFSLQGHERGVMLLPNGQRVKARHSETYAYATLDPQLKDELMLDRDSFEETHCLLRGSVTHDGLHRANLARLFQVLGTVIHLHHRIQVFLPESRGITHFAESDLTLAHPAVKRGLADVQVLGRLLDGVPFGFIGEWFVFHMR